MKNKILILSIVILIMSIGLASAFLGKYNQGECVNIIVPLDSSFVNISILTSPSPYSETLLSNVEMVSNGTAFTYLFCNTSRIGTYNYAFIDDTGKTRSNDFYVGGKSWFNLDFSTTEGIVTFAIILLISVLSLLFVHWELGCCFIISSGIISLVSSNNLYIGVMLIIVGVVLAFVKPDKK